MKTNVTIILMLLQVSLYSQDKVTSSTEPKSPLLIPDTSKNVLKESEILDSSLKHFPLINQAMQKVRVKQMGVREAEGSFDSFVKGKTDNRMEGYYDGTSTTVEITKPLSFLNSRVYGGYRVSDGKYPTYEGKMNTNEWGEYRIGAAVSLWQNRDIDENRFNLRNYRLEVEQSKLKLRDVKLKALKEASVAYWNWVAAGNILKVFQTLLETMLEREKGLRQRIKRGDLAAIYLSENKTYLLKRQSQVLKSRQKFQEATLQLSLYYRDEKGNPRIVNEDQLPIMKHDLSPLNELDLNRDLEFTAKSNPLLKRIDFEIQKNANEVLIGENKLDPTIDLAFEASQDQGDNDPTLEENEQRALLSFKIPIERNLGQGKIQKAKAKQNYNKKAKQYLGEQINLSIRAIFMELNTMSKVILNTKEEISLAEKLQKAEQQKFNSGASDFFVVFLRDENLANAELKYIESNFKFKKSYAQYRYLTQKFNIDPK